MQGKSWLFSSILSDLAKYSLSKISFNLPHQAQTCQKNDGERPNLNAKQRRLLSNANTNISGIAMCKNQELSEIRANDRVTDETLMGYNQYGNFTGETLYKKNILSSISASSVFKNKMVTDLSRSLSTGSNCRCCRSDLASEEVTYDTRNDFSSMDCDENIIWPVLECRQKQTGTSNPSMVALFDELSFLDRKKSVANFHISKRYYNSPVQQRNNNVAFHPYRYYRGPPVPVDRKRTKEYGKHQTKPPKKLKAAMKHNPNYRPLYAFKKREFPSRSAPDKKITSLDRLKHQVHGKRPNRKNYALSFNENKKRRSRPIYKYKVNEEKNNQDLDESIPKPLYDYKVRPSFTNLMKSKTEKNEQKNVYPLTSPSASFPTVLPHSHNPPPSPAPLPKSSAFSTIGKSASSPTLPYASFPSPTLTPSALKQLSSSLKTPSTTSSFVKYPNSFSFMKYPTPPTSQKSPSLSAQTQAPSSSPQPPTSSSQTPTSSSQAVSLPKQSSSQAASLPKQSSSQAVSLPKQSSSQAISLPKQSPFASSLPSQAVLSSKPPPSPSPSQATVLFKSSSSLKKSPPPSKSLPSSPKPKEPLAQAPPPFQPQPSGASLSQKYPVFPPQPANSPSQSPPSSSTVTPAPAKPTLYPTFPSSYSRPPGGFPPRKTESFVQISLDEYRMADEIIAKKKSKNRSKRRKVKVEQEDSPKSEKTLLKLFWKKPDQSTEKTTDSPIQRKRPERRKKSHS